MFYIGIDIGSSCSKVCVMDEENVFFTFMLPTGFNSKNTAESIKNMLIEKNIDIDNSKIVATGYGRVSVPYADDTVTEISCHGKGADYLFKRNTCVIDIGGQDTKAISLKNGRVMKFLMNDKCSAGTGKFLEIMANRLGVDLIELEELAKNGDDIRISSMCTVFAESEVISLIGEGKSREDIASWVINSVVTKVVSRASQLNATDYVLTGGFCENKYFIECLSKALNAPVDSMPEARYAGAIGASIYAKEKFGE